MTVDVDLDRLAEVVLSGFFITKLLFPPFPYFTYWKEVTMLTPI